MVDEADFDASVNHNRIRSTFLSMYQVIWTTLHAVGALGFNIVLNSSCGPREISSKACKKKRFPNKG